MVCSVAFQTIKPEEIIICDNGSTDGTVDVAEKALKESGLPYRIVTLPRDPKIGKWNINNTYWALSVILSRTGLRPDYVATIEADVTLEPRYFQTLIECVREDPSFGIACGKLDPFGLPRDRFPLGTSGVMLWGANRLYSWKCWTELTGMVDLRRLPTWDSDHVVLAVIKGYHILSVSEASATVHRHINPFRGMPKAMVDAAHGLPLWWASVKALQHRDLPYFVGFCAQRMSFGGGHYPSNEYQKGLNLVYRLAAIRVLKRSLGGLL